MMTLTEATAAYLAHLKEIGRSRLTIEAYRSDFKHLAATMDAQGITEPDAVSEAVLAEYLQDGIKGLSDKSRARKLAAFRVLWRWMAEHGMATADPTTGIRYKAAERMAENLPEEAAVEAVIAHAPIGSAARAAIELMTMGLTPAEAGRVKVDAFDPVAGTVVAVSNAGKERTVTLSASAICSLEAYLAGERKDLHPTSPYMFPSSVGTPRPRQVMYQMVKDACPAGVDLTPRSLRKARAVALLRMGVSPQEASEQLGLQAPTSIYQYAAAVKRMEGGAA